MTMNMIQVLDASKKVYEHLQQLEIQAVEVIQKLNSQETSVALREQKVLGIESALVVLNDAKRLKDEVSKLHEDLGTARADFDNYKTVELKKIADERTSLTPLLEVQKEVQRDKQFLYDAQIALEKEKAEYRERIRKEVIEHFKNTDGRG